MLLRAYDSTLSYTYNFGGCSQFAIADSIMLASRAHQRCLVGFSHAVGHLFCYRCLDDTHKSVPRNPNALHSVLLPAAVRCDMVLHQAFRARDVQQNGIDSEARHAFTSGVLRETSLDTKWSTGLFRSANQATEVLAVH